MITPSISPPTAFDDTNATAGMTAGVTAGVTAPDVAIAAVRPRQTARPINPFRTVLSGGVDLLVRGASVATSVVAGPTMAAVVRDVGSGASAALSAAPIGGRPGTVVSGVGPSSAAAVSTSLTTPGGDESDLAAVQSMQRESQAFNLQLLQLQEEVQQENRQFTTVSNVLRAKHDTAKAAVSNIRG